MKTDSVLGQVINEMLIEKGVETPMFIQQAAAKETITHHFGKIMEALGLDLNDDSLSGTPKRVGRMYVEEIFSGLDYNTFPKCTAVESKMHYDEMIIEKDVTVSSTCEHHFVVINGLAKIAYIPKGKILGLSKINRIVNFFARRPQIQERLGEQIYHALAFILETEDVAVEISAIHYCVKSRGIQDTNSYTVTRKLGGKFRENHETRNEFLN